VKQRKIDIQTYLRHLFATHPSLFDHNTAIDFLQLAAFSPDTHVRRNTAFSQPSSPSLSPSPSSSLPLCDITNLPPPFTYFDSKNGAGSVSVRHLLPGNQMVPAAGKASPCYGFYAVGGG
jgi:hypothetical protein